jgi:hypothetical protein
MVTYECPVDLGSDLARRMSGEGPSRSRPKPQQAQAAAGPSRSRPKPQQAQAVLLTSHGRDAKMEALLRAFPCERDSDASAVDFWLKVHGALVTQEQAGR